METGKRDSLGKGELFLLVNIALRITALEPEPKAQTGRSEHMAVTVSMLQRQDLAMLKSDV